MEKWLENKDIIKIEESSNNFNSINDVLSWVTDKKELANSDIKEIADRLHMEVSKDDEKFNQDILPLLIELHVLLEPYKINLNNLIEWVVSWWTSTWSSTPSSDEFLASWWTSTKSSTPSSDEFLASWWTSTKSNTPLSDENLT